MQLNSEKKHSQSAGNSWLVFVLFSPAYSVKLTAQQKTSFYWTLKSCICYIIICIVFYEKTTLQYLFMYVLFAFSLWYSNCLRLTLLSTCYFYDKSTEENPTELDIQLRIIVLILSITAADETVKSKILTKHLIDQALECICVRRFSCKWKKCTKFCSDRNRLSRMLRASSVFSGVVKPGKF